MQGERMRRVNEAVREIVSSAVTLRLNDPRIGFVTVTGVETSPDLRHATVFVSVLGGEAERDDTLAALTESRVELQHEIAVHLRMKNTPKLKFSYDDSVDRGMRMTELINRQAREYELHAREAEERMNDRAAIVERFREAEKYLLTTHENPDGDALGSLVGMNSILQALGKDTVMFMHEDEFPLPYEYRYLLADDQAIHFEPSDLLERTVVYLDCGQFERMDIDFLRNDALTLINIDHHHDNTRFGTFNLVEGRASCTAEIVYSLMKELGVELTPFLADALYVGLVTDSGRFMYQNTGVEAHRMAADLIENGEVDVHETYVRLFEDQPFGKVQLLARALSTLQRFDGGLVTVCNLTRADFSETGSEETFTEGIVDFARSISGTEVGVLVRELTGEGREHQSKISLRSSGDRVDVSAIARSFGGGGHRQAAGATTEKSLEEAIQAVREAVREQLATDRITAA
jgi:phosphoesterase RecJ-like protein